MPSLIDDDEPPPLEIVTDIDWDLPDLEPVADTIPTEQLPVPEKVEVTKPVAKEPEPKKPVAKKPEPKKPVAKKPEPKKPVAKEPEPKKPVAKKPEPKATPPKSRSTLKAEAMKNEGNVAIGKGDYDKAIELYTRAIALDKVNINREGAEGYLLYCNRAKAYMAKKQFKWALKDAEIAIKIKPDFAKAHYRAAVAHEGLKNEEKAIEEFCEVAKFVPGDVSIAKKLSNLIHFKPDVEYMVKIILNPSYTNCTAFLDITSAYMCKLLSPKSAEYAKISQDEKKDDSSFEDQLKARQKMFVENNGGGVAKMLIKSKNKRLKHYGKKFQKIVKNHTS